MAESSWPTPSAGRVVDDVSYEKMAVSYGPAAGVVGDFTSPQLIYADSTGMQIKIAADRYALVRGHEWYSGSTIVTKTISANASGSTRTDLVVLRLSRTTWDVTCQVIAGTPGAGAPSPTQNVGTTGSFDLPLATVTVANGAATITAANVTYVAAHLMSDGSGLVAPSTSALSYVPIPVSGQTARISDGTEYTWTGSVWKPTVALGFARKTVQENVSSSTTVQNDDQLFLTVVANAAYEFRMMIKANSQATDDFKIGFTAPSGSTFDWAAAGLLPAAAGFTDDQTGMFNLASQITFGGLGGTSVPIFSVGMLVTSSTAGTFQLQWAQGTSSASATSLMVGSWIRLDRVA